MLLRLRRFAVASVFILTVVSTGAQEQVAYRLSFPERAHRIMNVEIALSGLPAAPLQLRMSRSSPGRYALHEFAKNVFDVRVTDAAGRALAVTRPDPYGWEVPVHGDSVRVSYRVFGDRTDGTYLGIDSMHAHVNMPAALMWVRGLELRPVTVRFEPPPGTSWRVATQLLPGSDEYTYTAPNLQYLIDSPSEFSDFALRTFSIPDNGRSLRFRFAAHHDGTDAELDAFMRDVEQIVREARHVFGEYPAYEGNTYTFIADFLPWVISDGMEHRNSTILTSPSSIRSNRMSLLDTVSHEFFHGWNVERIRPKSLEPFNLEQTNMSGELWLGEGFTSYYGPLILRRAGLLSVGALAAELGDAINTVLTSPGRALRTVREMSELAAFVDAAVSIDRTNVDNTYISYYTWGSAIGLGLDLTLRDRTDGTVTLDHFMRALWQKHGKPGGRAQGHVDNPYTVEDLKTALASVSKDAAFARDFFARYIEGHEAIDYGRLLARAGIVLRPVAPGQAWAGAIRFQDTPAGVRVTGYVPFGSPAYEAGLDREDVVVSLGGTRVTSAAEWSRRVQRGKPGEVLPMTFERRGQTVSASLRLAEDPRVQGVVAEEVGQTLSAAQRAFRDAWLSSAGRNAL